MKKTISGSSLDTEALPSSVNAVIHNDDLLIEILLRLPVISLILFKSVSKRWLSLITGPISTLRRTQNPYKVLDPVSGLYIQHSKNNIHFMPLDDRILAKTYPCDARDIQVLQSCNGLFLCYRFHNRCHQYYIYNPSTNHFKTISRSPKGNSMRLAFDPRKSPHYKVLCVEHAKDDGHGNNYQIKSYSSETCSWSVWPHQFPFKVVELFKDGIYCNDAIHVLDNVLFPELYLINYKIYHLKLDLRHLAFTKVPIPIYETFKQSTINKLFESRDCLFLVCIRPRYSKYANIYEYSNDCLEWSLKYYVNFDNVISLCSKNWNMSDKIGSQFDVLYMVVGEKEEDSFLVITLYGKVVQYKIVSKTISKQLCDCYDKGSRIFPFIASFAGV